MNQVVAETEVNENDPLLLNYGCLSNDFFLLDYGFVIESNPYDTIELKYDEQLLDAASMAAGVASPKFSSPAPWQHQLLSQLNLAGKMPDLKVSNRYLSYAIAKAVFISEKKNQRRKWFSLIVFFLFQ